MKNFTILILMLVSLNLSTHSQRCTLDPNLFFKSVSGYFDSNPSENSRTSIMLMGRYWYQEDYYLRLYKYSIHFDQFQPFWGQVIDISDGTTGQTGPDVVVGPSGAGDLIGDRIVEGDFNNDGDVNDIAILFHNGIVSGAPSMRIRLWNNISGNTSSTNYISNAWTSPSGSTYDVSKINGRIVSGDFDSDGFHDDIAAFYDYGTSNTKIHVWKGNGLGGFSYQWWWESSGYHSSKITDRVVSGDFDRDGKIDDIAAVYDYGNGAARIHVFHGNNANYFSYLNSSGWWSTSYGYNPTLINKRITSGNFDWSGLPALKHKNDDIVALYDYGNGNVKAHTWTSNGSSFSYSWRWEASGFDATKVSNRFNNIQFLDLNTHATDMDKCFEMAALYNYGSNTNKYYFWSAASGNNWQFNPQWNYACSDFKISDPSQAEITEYHAGFFPNPIASKATLLTENELENASLIIYDILGNIVMSHNNIFGRGIEFERGTLQAGLYIYRLIENGIEISNGKIVIVN